MRGEWVKRFTTMVLVLGVSLFCLTAYGSSDSGLKLKNWYDRAFGFAVKDVVADYFAGVIQLGRSVSNEKKDQALEASNELVNFSSLVSENSGKEAENYQQRYIDIANETEERLKGENFSALEQEEKLKLETELEADIDEILAEALQ